MLLNWPGINAVMAAAAGGNPKLDLSIEGMRSQRFGVGVFIFLMIGILVFSGIIYVVLFGKHAPKTTKKGEMVMFAAIILGVLVAVAFGATQMLSGFLF
jgi:hypothetical protein